MGHLINLMSPLKGEDSRHNFLTMEIYGSHTSSHDLYLRAVSITYSIVILIICAEPKAFCQALEVAVRENSRDYKDSAFTTIYHHMNQLFHGKTLEGCDL